MVALLNGNNSLSRELDTQARAIDFAMREIGDILATVQYSHLTTGEVKAAIIAKYTQLRFEHERVCKAFDVAEGLYAQGASA